MPLEQYPNQLKGIVWEKLHNSLYPQVETELWCDLNNELFNELYNRLFNESLEHELKEELRSICYP